MGRGGGQGRIAKISGMCWEWITGMLPHASSRPQGNQSPAFPQPGTHTPRASQTATSSACVMMGKSLGSSGLRMGEGLPWWHGGWESAANAGDTGSSPGPGRSHMLRSN